MAVLLLIDSVSVGISKVGAQTEPNRVLMTSASIGRSPVGGHTVAENAIVTNASAGLASPAEFKDMSVIKTIEI